MDTNSFSLVNTKEKFFEAYMQKFFDILSTTVIERNEIKSIDFVTNPSWEPIRCPWYLLKVQYSWSLWKDEVKTILESTMKFQIWENMVNSKFVILNWELEIVSNNFYNETEKKLELTNVYSSKYMWELLQEEKTNYYKEAEILPMVRWDFSIKKDNEGNFYIYLKPFSIIQISQETHDSFLEKMKASLLKNETLDEDKIWEFLSQSISVIQYKNDKEVQNKISNLLWLEKTTHWKFFTIYMKGDDIYYIYNQLNNTHHISEKLMSLPWLNSIIPTKKERVILTKEEYEIFIMKPETNEKEYSSFFATEIEKKEKEIKEHFPTFFYDLFHHEVKEKQIHKEYNLTLYKIHTEYDYSILDIELYENYREEIKKYYEKWDEEQMKEIFNTYYQECLNHETSRREMIEQNINITPCDDMEDIEKPQIQRRPMKELKYIEVKDLTQGQEIILPKTYQLWPDQKRIWVITRIDFEKKEILVNLKWNHSWNVTLPFSIYGEKVEVPDETKEEIQQTEILWEEKIQRLKNDLQERSSKRLEEFRENMGSEDQISIIIQNVQTYFRKLKEFCTTNEISIKEFDPFVNQEFLKLYKNITQ